MKSLTKHEVPQISTLRLIQETEWSSYAKRLDAKVKLMNMLKHVMELTLLTCVFLSYYLIDCLVEAISML